MLRVYGSRFGQMNPERRGGLMGRTRGAREDADVRGTRRREGVRARERAKAMRGTRWREGVRARERAEAMRGTRGRDGARVMGGAGA